VFGTLGFPEMIIIFLLALVLFGPNKLPEIGRTIGKAITEFRKASSELKETFTTEYQNLERETESLKQAATESISEGSNDYQYDSNAYSYDYSFQESQTTEESQADSAASDPSSESASAPQGAEFAAEPPEGAIAHGSVIEEPALAEAAEPGETGDPQPPEAPASTSAEHNKA
jgi:sec-independent protein translocase protein TatA